MRPIAIAALLAASIAGGAHADPALADCKFETVAQELLTGGPDTYVGVAYGYATSTAVEAVTVRCYLTVDGAEASTTPTGSGTTFAATHGLVTFTASDSQEVSICAEWTRGTASGTTCTVSTTTQIPPQWVIDCITYGCWGPPPTYDWVLCYGPETLGLPSVPGVVDIDDEGDIAVAGIPFWDCPPYDFAA